MNSERMISAMVSHDTQSSGDGFSPPGIIKVSAAALKLARDFHETIKATRQKDWVVSFDWSDSIIIRRDPNEPPEDIGACLTLGAYERHQIPPGFVQRLDGLEFAIKIPPDVWQKSVQRLIDVDTGQLFKLTLR